MNAFSAVFSFITLVHQEELANALSFVYTHPEMVVHLIIFCISSTVGQLFIFYTGKHYSEIPTNFFHMILTVVHSIADKNNLISQLRISAPSSSR
jgi:hypothetical protein